MKIKISSDSTCDLSPELLKKYDITIAPLYINRDGEFLKDAREITSAEIIEYTALSGKLCSTAAVSQYDYSELFAEELKEADAVIHITLSSEMSSCYQNACNAAAELENVYVVDSRNLSSGQGHVVVQAAKLAAEENADPAAIVEKLNDIATRVEASFILDRLDYMVKGGRCSMVAALGANLLKLKPCIEVADGKMRMAKKYRGNIARCVKDYVKDRLDGRDDIINDLAFITFPSATDEMLAAAHNAVDEYGHFDEVIETNAGCTITCHCGPNTLGVLFIRK